MFNKPDKIAGLVKEYKKYQNDPLKKKVSHKDKVVICDTF